jgi:diguanylate cyclase (GGDEF)-like protein/PAS domain S-box-containing protein
MMVADVVWAHLSLNGSFQAGNVQDLPYLVQYVLFAMAVAEERRRLAQGDADTFDHSSGSVSALPYVAVVGGYALFIGAALNELTRELLPVAAGAVVLTALIIAKQIMALRENARLDLERTMLAGEKRFKSLIQHASDVVSIIDGHWQVRFASPSAAQILGYPAASLVGRSVLDLMHPDDLADATQRLKDLIRRPGEIITARWRLRHHEGHWVQTDTTATNLIGDENIRGLVLASRDITERVSMETRLTHQAFHDPLTGLANRTLFQHRIGEALARRRADGGIVAVLFIDLDKFKDANDGYGHAFGDAILRAAGERIVSGLRRFDTAARLGGDEFAVLIDDPSGVTDPVGISERLAHTFHAPVRIEGRDIVVTASIGVAVATNDHGADELQRDADLAMYLAKGRGRGQAATFEPSLHAALVSRLELQADLEEAATRGELRLVYQPLHALDSHQLVGAEAFIRWHHPARGVIPPDVFIPIAEETGLILPMGRWVLEQACADARRWMRDEPGHPPVRLSINVSGRQVAESSLADDVERALRSSGLEGSRLVLELPESILLDHTPTTLAVIGEIRRLGIHIAIDDFGTGYSSLSYLQRLPIDELKIDRSFVERLATDRGTAALTRAIVAIASTLSLRTVAEGIQTAEDAEHLRQLGCQWGQGFFFSRPMPIDEFELYTRRCRIISAA